MSKICEALGKAQSQIRGAVKESVNPHFRSRYADLESVIDAIRKPLADNDLAFMQTVVNSEVHTVILHADGGQLSSCVPFVGEFKDMQKVGAALTYARRQGLCTAFGVPAVDDDGNEAAGHNTSVVPNTVNHAAKPAPVPKKTPTPIVAPVEKPIDPGLLTDGRLPDEKPDPSVKPFSAPKAEQIGKDLERYGLGTVESVTSIYPLFVDGRDNDLVKAIMNQEKIPLAKLTKHGAALKKFCSETQEFTTLHDAVVEFFMRTK